MLTIIVFSFLIYIQCTIHTFLVATSDADVEDNTDSEYVRNSLTNTRHPSIVVDTSVDSLLDGQKGGMDNR